MHAGQRYRAFTRRFKHRANVLFTDVNISLPYDPRTDLGKAPPNLLSCRAIWDTGASNSVITKSLVKRVGLIPSGKGKVANTSRIELRNTFMINIVLPSKVIVSYVKVTECEDVLDMSDNGNADMLIGMDVIGAGDFAVTQENGNTVMSFIIPSTDVIDYVPISEEKNRKLDISENIDKEKISRSAHQLSRAVIRAKRKTERKNRKRGRRKR